MQGIIQCFENNFEDFLTYTEKKQIDNHEVFVRTRWNGSFWHHDIGKDEIRQEFTRRNERLLGQTETLESTTRFVVHVLNSTQEIDMAMHLVQVLQQTYALAPVYLLLIVENQEV